MRTLVVLTLLLPWSIAPAYANPCDRCKEIQADLDRASAEMEQLRSRQAEVEDAYDANLEEQLGTIEAENEATRRYNAQIGTGGSSVDPTTGIRIEARAGADGVVTITTTYPDGRTETQPRDSRYMKELQQQISNQRRRRGELERAADALKKELNELAGEIRGKAGEIDGLARGFSRCLEDCETTELVINPASHLAVHVAAGHSPQDVINDYGLEDAEIVSVPESAGGGHFISAPKPGKDTREEMENDPRLETVDDDFCREFLPGTEAIPHDKQPLMLAQADTGGAQGVTSNSAGATLRGTTVTIMPEDPPVDGADPGWQSGDGGLPAMGVTGDDGTYRLAVDKGVLSETHIVVAGSGWTTVTHTGGGGPDEEDIEEVVVTGGRRGGGTGTSAPPSDNGGGTATGGGPDEVELEEIIVTGGYKSGLGGTTITLGGGYGGGTIVGGDDGDDPRDTPVPPVYGEEIDEPERVGILLRHDAWFWVPRMNAVTWVTAKLYAPDPARPGIWRPIDGVERIITVRFVRRSNEPGQAMNWDVGFAPEDSPDLYLRSDASLRCSDDPTGESHFGTCVTVSPHNEKQFTVDSIDWGGYSRMEATCEDCVPLRAVYPYSFIGGYRPGKAWPDAVEEPVREHRLVRVPHDENSNNIADAFELRRRRAGIAADEDLETDPWGNGVKGDGYTAYQEYRGFVNKNIQHRRTNWNKKTLLVDNRTGMSLGQYRRASGLDVLEISRGSHKNRKANYNHNFAHAVDQHCLIFKYEELGDDYAGMSFGFGPPKNVEKVTLDWSYGDDANGTVAHELGHATGMRHHGDKSLTEIEVHPHSNVLSGLAHSYTHAGVDLCGTFLPAKFDLGEKGDQSSGVEDCLMRYNGWADIYEQANGTFHCHRKGRTRRLFCDASTGTGQNVNNQVSGNATMGDCKGQLIVNDNS